MFNPESIHNHIQLVKQLGMCFSSIKSDLQGWDAAWKAFYLVTPFSTRVQTHQLLILFDLCLETWRETGTLGEKTGICKVGSALNVGHNALLRPPEGDEKRRQLRR
ncbi:hypothetical protein BT69DRAFT_1296613 [Atractiella rhizophila]|nr:hypothetical protein BT69DRAFT_1296613 [Atractiella rhizophila]